MGADRALTRRAAALLCAPLLLGALAAPLEPAREEVDAERLARRAEDALRGERSQLEARLVVESAAGDEERVVVFRAWADRPRRRAFVRVLAPEEDADTRFLAREPNLWVTVPGSGRTLLVPRSAHDKPWLGGDFSHRDLLFAPALDDYRHRVLGIDPGPPGTPAARAWVVEGIRRTPSAPWARVVTWVQIAHGVPLRREFFDAEGVLRRVLVYSDFRDVGGRRVPHRWVLDPADRDGRTRIEIEWIRLDGSFDDEVFSTRRLIGEP